MDAVQESSHGSSWRFYGPQSLCETRSSFCSSVLGSKSKNIEGNVLKWLQNISHLLRESESCRDSAADFQEEEEFLQFWSEWIGSSFQERLQTERLLHFSSSRNRLEEVQRSAVFLFQLRGLQQSEEETVERTPHEPQVWFRERRRLILMVLMSSCWINPVSDALEALVFVVMDVAPRCGTLLLRAVCLVLVLMLAGFRVVPSVVWVKNSTSALHAAEKPDNRNHPPWWFPWQPAGQRCSAAFYLNICRCEGGVGVGGGAVHTEGEHVTDGRSSPEGERLTRSVRTDGLHASVWISPTVEAGAPCWHRLVTAMTAVRHHWMAAVRVQKVTGSIPALPACVEVSLEQTLTPRRPLVVKVWIDALNALSLN